MTRHALNGGIVHAIGREFIVRAEELEHRGAAEDQVRLVSRGQRCRSQSGKDGGQQRGGNYADRTERHLQAPQAHNKARETPGPEPLMWGAFAGLKGTEL